MLLTARLLGCHCSSECSQCRLGSKLGCFASSDGGQRDDQKGKRERERVFSLFFLFFSFFGYVR